MKEYYTNYYLIWVAEPFWESVVHALAGASKEMDELIDGWREKHKCLSNLGKRTKGKVNKNVANNLYWLFANADPTINGEQDVLSFL